MLDFIAQTYGQALPEKSEDEARRVVDSAIERAKEKHPDFERFLPAIDALSMHFFTDHTQMPIDAYIETLYAAVKHGDFTKEWRMQLKRALN